MYSGIAAFDFIFSILLVPIWAAAVVVMGRLTTRGTQRKLRRGTRIAGVLIIVGLVLTIGRLAGLIGLATYGWTFVSDRKVGTVLFMVAAAVVVTVFARPRLIALRRLAAGDQQPPSDELRAVAYRPWLIVPVQAAALAALPGLFEKFLPPYQAALPTFLVAAAILGLLTWLLAVRANRRHAKLAGPNPSRPAAVRTLVVRLGVVVVLAAMAVTLMSIGGATSKLPETFSMMQGRPDFGGGVEFAHDGHGPPGAGSGQGAAPGRAVSVEQLRGPADGPPDRTFTLTVQEKQVTFPSGQTFDAWTFNGQVPGPELRVKEGELVEVKLVNNLRDAPVSVHWHGLDVPNGEDGVAGVTQDAVQPGQSYTYRFRAEEVGTRWYHSHQQASEQVNRGLFGPLVIEPRQPARVVDVDKTVVLHDWTRTGGEPIRTYGGTDTLDRQQLAAGSKVRLRLVNTSNVTKHISVTGVPYRVTAYDGTDVHEPSDLTNTRLPVPGAGRYDVEFTMPSSPVRIADTANPSGGIVYSPDGKGEVGPDVSGPELDPLSYGKPADTPFDAGSRFDRNFTLVFDVWLGFYNGSFALRQTINGQVFPDAPMHMVREGELIKMTFINRGEEDHPMHLHGHHFLVLGKNGNRPTGSPVWLDTVNVSPGDIVEIGFRADNPGIWMDHCHNLTHTVLGMVLHLTYENVTSPYLVGGAAHNHPD